MASDRSGTSFDKKLSAVEQYLKGKRSLRAIAQDAGVPHSTLHEWVRQYQRGGPEALRKKIGRAKRIAQEIEEKVMLLKERTPAVTVRRAAQILKKQGISISQKGVWLIWRRYGLTKRSIDEPLSPFCAETPETAATMKRVRKLIKNRTLAAARVVNSMPCLPSDPIIREIPWKYLSLLRQRDRLYREFGEMPFPEFARRAHALTKKLEAHGYMYSSILTVFFELIALGWIGKPKKKLPLLKTLAKKMKHLKDNALWFLFYFEQARSNCIFLHVDRALDYVKKCRQLVYHLRCTYYEDVFGDLLGILGNYKEAARFWTKALGHTTDQGYQRFLRVKIAIFDHAMTGTYSASKKMLAQALQGTKDVVLLSADVRLCQAYIAFGLGNLDEAAQRFRESMERASKEELYNLLYITSVGLAAVEMALNREAAARQYLTKYMPLMKKSGLLVELHTLQQLLGAAPALPQKLLRMYTFALLNLLVNAHAHDSTVDYQKAYRFARKHNMLGLLHRWIVFFPRPVVRLLEKGKKTGLPGAILKFPVFREHAPVFRLQLLGRLIVTRNQQYQRMHLSPQEQAFLIHVALRAGSPGRTISTQDMYRNFWRTSKDPMNRCAHVLTRLRQQLKIPGHLLAVSSARGESRLVNRGVHLTTDYGEFQTLLAQAQSLVHAGEWDYAARDYARAFRLLHGEPFKKMYDPWSEQMRAVVFNDIEKVTAQYVEGCIEHNDIRAAEQMLKKVQAMIPHSQQLSTLTKKLET